MSLANIKKLQAEKGFTIVELLIVIVVIGILAAIVIVAYNGIQSRANVTARNTTAENLAKKIEAYNAVKSAYPTYNTASAVGTQLNTVTDSAITGSGIKILAGTQAATDDNNTVKLAFCTTASPTAGTTVPAGYIVYIWDASLTAPGPNPVQAGGNATITNGASGIANTVACSGTSSTVSPAN